MWGVILETHFFNALRSFLNQFEQNRHAGWQVWNKTDSDATGNRTKPSHAESNGIRMKRSWQPFRYICKKYQRKLGVAARSGRLDDPRFLAMNAITSQPGWQDTTIPYMLHGDGAVFTFNNQQKLLSINVKSLVCDNRFSPHIIPLFCIVETVRCKLKEGYLTDSLTDVWAHVLQVLYYIQFQSSLLYCVLLRSTAFYCTALYSVLLSFPELY